MRNRDYSTYNTIKLYNLIKNENSIAEDHSLLYILIII